MRVENTFLTLIILFVFFQISFGQEKPEAVLVDEFSALSCDEFLARSDYFFTSLQNNPDSQGYAVISGANAQLHRKISYELLIKGYIAARRFDDRRIILVRSGETKTFSVSFWRVPSGAEKPDFKETKWNFVFPPGSKPFKFYDDAADIICPPTPFENVYIEFLKANPQARGNIVIYAKSFKKYNNFKNEARNSLKDISSKRLRFFHVKRNYSSNYANIEYWIVPRKKK